MILWIEMSCEFAVPREWACVLTNSLRGKIVCEKALLKHTTDTPDATDFNPLWPHWKYDNLLTFK